jgi:beta-galactosidase
MARNLIWLLITGSIYGMGTVSASADFLPSRICKIRTIQNLNQSWKFIKADPGGASAASFNDASWQTINLPHSAQYDAPTVDAEQQSVPQSSGWNGVHWYRRSFTIPSTAHNQKVFIGFDGAMQIADVYVNGTLVGTHDACGYTGFAYDISSSVNRSGTNILAIKLDCRYRNNIPPGRAGTFSAAGNNIEYPDFFLYSGLYRDVWLVCADNVFVPVKGQRIETPAATSSSARVRVRTTVRNDNAAAKSVTVSFCIVDRADAIVATYDQTGQIGANGSRTFDTLCAPLVSPKLWTPESPVLYRIFTKVTADGQVVDDYAERFGIRSVSWTKAGGFSLNGQRYLLKGVCMHQEFPWVENAVPRSRFFEEVRLAKEMGANAVRCSHYPRAPAFYNACDELGMVCLPEIPSWGCCGTAAYPADFWDRMNVVAQEMVSDGYNHPSIIIWGIFNEPGDNFQTQFNRLNTTLHGLDSTRPTAVYGSSTQLTYLGADISGMNYEIYPNANIRTQVTGAFVSEYHEGWIKWCYRGDTVTTNDASLSGSLSENRFAADRWSGSNNWTQILAAWNGSTQPVPGGGFMWCFADYWSPVQDYPMGVLDHYRIPKKAFYTFRANWVGTADDNFDIGLTPTRVQLDADLATLTADSTDITRIVGSLRDASGNCAFAARSIALQIAGPADCFDPLTKTTIAGKIGWVLKSKNTTGTIKVIGSSSGLTSDTISITSVAPDNSSLPFIWPQSAVNHKGLLSTNGAGDKVKYIAKRITITFNAPGAWDAIVSLCSMQGKSITCPAEKNNFQVIIDIRNVPAGVYLLKIGNTTVKRILIARRA